MSELAYGPFEVRADIRAAHDTLWRHIATPGTWWTGAEHVAIATAARDADGCRLCAERKAALSPAAVRGEHEGDGSLPANVVDVVHRIRSDPARLSRAWFDEVTASGLEVARYVELVGVVTMVTGVDWFARSLGIALFALPDPRPGAPSRYRPSSAADTGAWVPMIAPEDAAGAEADLYPAGAIIPNIIRALSLVPDEVRVLLELAAAHYLGLEDLSNPMAHRSLDRMQMELVAARVSALNQCFY